MIFIDDHWCKTRNREKNIGCIGWFDTKNEYTCFFKKNWGPSIPLVVAKQYRTQIREPVGEGLLVCAWYLSAAFLHTCKATFTLATLQRRWGPSIAHFRIEIGTPASLMGQTLVFLSFLQIVSTKLKPDNFFKSQPGRMQEVEYRILMWTLSPEQRKRAQSLEKGPLGGSMGTWCWPQSADIIRLDRHGCFLSHWGTPRSHPFLDEPRSKPLCSCQARGPCKGVA